MAGIKQITETNKKKKAPRDKWLTKIIDEHLTEVDTPPRGGVFHPSALGNPCDRYLWLYYNAKIPEQILEARIKRIFQNGNFLEDRVALWLTDLNILIDREISLKQELPPISGRMDFLIKHLEYGELPVELKSINKFGFTQLSAAKPEHFTQLQMYLNMSGYDHGTVLYECKDDQHLKAFLIERDEEAWADILKRCFDIQAMTIAPDKCTGAWYCVCKKVKGVEDES